ncbi:chromophore lyase CpcT/CpeT [Prochlorococcus sp. MIT 1223]|uniref:chromophore lyase CpcT/CpeT n=1 Tax=Prochlorococcus sp. MIT 1223 TaxID=3096217 RepID=UPI002A758C8B|nr:chromophore lyase CpcT/CpeT [Prochlorococcus sp. MIT 1223]
MSTRTNQLIINFAKTISGKYSNQKQANEQPQKFAHINIYFMPLSYDLLNSPGFYTEQSYDYDPWTPYRQAILKIHNKGNIIITENFEIKNSIRIAGAGSNPNLLKEIEIEKLSLRKGCSMHFRKLNKADFLGKIEPGKKCLGRKENATVYINSHVYANDSQWISKDEGFDINTQCKIWGSNDGPFIFSKEYSLNDYIDRNWL